MAQEIARGQIWMLGLPRPDKRRPVLVLSRPALIAVLHTVTVAAVTRTLRGVPTEVELGPEVGLKESSCVNLVNVFTVPKAQLRSFVGTVPQELMQTVCEALAVAVGCE